MRRANEIKHPVAIERNVDELLAFLDECGFDKAGSVPVWLQPIWQAPKSRAICYEACMTHGFRMSVQTHKVLGLR
jgi:7-carboxy-7-deazaguanine synthase